MGARGGTARIVFGSGRKMLQDVENSENASDKFPLVLIVL